MLVLVLVLVLVQVLVLVLREGAVLGWPTAGMHLLSAVVGRRWAIMQTTWILRQTLRSKGTRMVHRWTGGSMRTTWLWGRRRRDRAVAVCPRCYGTA